MDLYRIICPYCKHEHLPFGYEGEGYGAVVCDECARPFVNQTTWSTVYHSFALVGVEQPVRPTMEKVQKDIEEDPEQQVTLPGEPVNLYPDWQPTPGHKNGSYRIDGEYVEIRYLLGHPVRTTLADIHMLCDESNPTAIINTLLGTVTDTRNTAALNAFIRAVKRGEVVL